jgi:CubicO group peptidase (beta-lactamase class C family)
MRKEARAAIPAAVAVAVVLALSGTPSPAREPAALAAPVEALFSAIPGETRALLVLQNGKPVVERYRDGFDAKVRFVSWSMAKSVTAIALGMLVDEGKLKLDAPAPVAVWSKPGDPRAAITLRHLMNMTSGLEHQEGTEDGKKIETADTVRLLFTDGARSAAAYSVAKPLAHPPGSVWKYSTATSHILSDIVTNAVTSEIDAAKRRAIMAKWFADRLWTPLGITSAEWDFDEAGLFLGGSMLHMTTRDWARLGEFMLARGITPGGKRLLSDAMIAELLKKAEARNNNQYAGHFWLNTGPMTGQSPVLFHPVGGADTFAMIGHLGQYVVVVPSKQAVIVRLGKTANRDRGPVRTELGRLVEALPAQP